MRQNAHRLPPTQSSESNAGEAGGKSPPQVENYGEAHHCITPKLKRGPMENSSDGPVPIFFWAQLTIKLDYRDPGASPPSFVLGDGFMGSQTHLLPKFSFSLDFGHFISKMLEKAKFPNVSREKILKCPNFGGDIPRWFFDCGGRVPPSPRFRRSCPDPPSPRRVPESPLLNRKGPQVGLERDLSGL